MWVVGEDTRLGGPRDGETLIPIKALAGAPAESPKGERRCPSNRC